jgi:geranylgeranyl diphosphate synthase type II
MLAGGDAAQIKAIGAYGEKIGLAFQIADDILDVEGDSLVLGKGVGGDTRKGKITYPATLGLEQSKKIQRNMVEDALAQLRSFDRKADPLRHIATYIIERKK